ncbi:MAG: carbohydrate kinase family protein [Phycisphaeraceae bacterium JB051]
MRPLDNDQSIIVAGHICLDLTPAFVGSATATLDPGTLTRVGQMQRSVGGSVANTGMALHQLGVKTRLMGRVSDDLFGDEVLRLLGQASPFLTQGMIRVFGESTSYSVVIAPPGVDRMFLHCPGCNDQFQASNVALPDDANIKLLHFGYPPVMRSIYQHDGCELVQIFDKAHASGIATSLDMCSVDPDSEAGSIDWCRWLKHVLPHVDIFVPSLDELLFMIGHDQCNMSLALLQSVGKQMLDWGVGVLLLKLGEYGVYLQTADRVHHLFDGVAWSGQSQYRPCFSVDVASTNGAGDYTIAGFLTAILEGYSPHEALSSAVGVGASHVESPNQLSDWQAIQQRIASGWRQHDKALI